MIGSSYFGVNDMPGIFRACVKRAGKDVFIRVQELYPGPYDLVLVPIGFVRDILSAAADFATLLNTRRLAPMHYWTPQDRDAFSALMDARYDSRGHPYRVRQQPGA